MPGLCPKCQQPVGSLRGDALEVTFISESYKAATYSCPACNTIISAEIDPIALRSDIVNLTTDAVIERLRQ